MEEKGGAAWTRRKRVFNRVEAPRSPSPMRRKRLAPSAFRSGTRPRSWRRLTNRRPRTRRLCKPPGGLSSAMDVTRIELLTAKHERGTFDCGKPPLNAFIRQHATVNHERGVSRVYVAVRGPQQRVWPVTPRRPVHSCAIIFRQMTRLDYPDTRSPRLTLAGWPSICPAEASVWANFFSSTS